MSNCIMYFMLGLEFSYYKTNRMLELEYIFSYRLFQKSTIKYVKICVYLLFQQMNAENLLHNPIVFSLSNAMNEESLAQSNFFCVKRFNSIVIFTVKLEK